MKVLHIESGLGNQMLDYCDYLAVKKMNPEQECYIETITFEIPECSRIICQWNGYELDKVFGLQTKNIKSLFDDHEWENIIREISVSEFWSDNWNWPIHYSKVLNDHGLNLVNHCGDNSAKINSLQTNKLKKIIRNTKLSPMVKSIKHSFLKHDNISKSFIPSDEDSLDGHTLAFMYKGGGVERIEHEVRKAFEFPEFCDDLNLSSAEEIVHCNSIAIHVRRGDALAPNEQYFKSGYFKRAVKYIKKTVSDPVFFMFSEPKTERWIKENLNVFSLDNAKDSIRYVSWNDAVNSYNDMHLMSLCKHNIISFSSFGWWGAYLNKNPSKITISPEPNILTTHWM